MDMLLISVLTFFLYRMESCLFQVLDVFVFVVLGLFFYIFPFLFSASSTHVLVVCFHIVMF